MNESKTIPYLKHIDGLRAIAVIAVIFFHLGYLPYGYLGVDIFFVISGYLITKIIYNEAMQRKFSIVNFYLRRIRRILPLVFFTTAISLLVGLFVMLPDDFENLSQSVFATNFFANNILLYVTVGNYWDVVNEYKPLMHTWSLGVEEQFYLLFPLIFVLLNGEKVRFILPTLIALSIASVIFFIHSANEASKFYLIQYRFFELSLGGIGAIVFFRAPIYFKHKWVLILTIVSLLLFNFHLHPDVQLLLVVLISVAILVSENNETVSGFILENRLMINVGKISFSLYMWHQIVFAYTRYFIVEEISIGGGFLLLLIIILLSIFSYSLIEQPFRNVKKVRTVYLLSGLAAFLVCSTTVSFYFYRIGGIVRDVPELEVRRGGNVINSYNNFHSAYNARVYELQRGFRSSTKTNVLVIGNSFARDAVNILLESDVQDLIEVSYIYNIDECKDVKNRFLDADFIFFSTLSMKEFEELRGRFQIDRNKVWNFGEKNFGYNNGIFYAMRNQPDYCALRTKVLPGILENNFRLKNEWGDRYIDLIGLIVDGKGKVPVFTSDCKFISQDCRHLTEAGAAYFASLLDFEEILGIKQSHAVALK